MSRLADPALGFFEVVDIKRIRPSNQMLRRTLGSIDELMACIVERGLLEPIVVRRTNEGLEVVAGHRRLEACKQLRMTKIPCHLVDLDDREAYETSLIENLHHQTLDPLEEAEAFRKYVDDYGFGGASDLAKRIGKSPSFVSRRMALLKLPGEIREELLRRRKGPGLAQELLPLTENQKEEVGKLILENKIKTRRAVRNAIRQARANPTDGDCDNGLELYSYSDEERRQHATERAISKAIASLKECMGRLDYVIDDLDKDAWLTMETLARSRRLVHGQIDELMNLKKKMTSRNVPLV